MLGVNLDTALQTCRIFRTGMWTGAKKVKRKCQNVWIYWLPARHLWAAAASQAHAHKLHYPQCISTLLYSGKYRFDFRGVFFHSFQSILGFRSCFDRIFRLWHFFLILYSPKVPAPFKMYLWSNNKCFSNKETELHIETKMTSPS